MSYSLNAYLVGAGNPSKVQVVIGGLAAGDSYEVVGQYGDQSWDVRAGSGTSSAGGQVVLIDTAAPINVPITYQVTVNSSTVVTSNQVTVTWSTQLGDPSLLLASIDGSILVPLWWRNNAAPREVQTRAAVFRVPGRTKPVVVYDASSGTTAELLAATDGDGTASMLDLLAAGGVAILRTNGTVRDIPLNEFMVITRAPSTLTDVGTERRWQLIYEVIEDPEPDTALPTSTWDDFDAAYASSTWSSFDSEWTGQTWDVFDRTDWTAH